VSYSIDIDTPNHLVISKCWNEHSSEEFLTYLDEIEALGPFDMPYQLLVVMHDDVKLTLDTETVRLAARRNEVFSKSADRVVVAPDSLGFGLGKVYSLSSKGVSDKYSIVKNLEEGCAVLHVDPVVVRKSLGSDW